MLPSGKSHRERRAVNVHGKFVAGHDDQTLDVECGEERLTWSDIDSIHELTKVYNDLLRPGRLGEVHPV